MRETLFNWLGQTLYGKQCLDLFAGSGALGFEAASRGAARVVMVERNRTVFRSLRENAEKLGGANIDLHCEDGLEFARHVAGGYDVVFLDPPFRSNLLPEALACVAPRLNPGALVYAESGAELPLPPGWQIYKQGKAGAVCYQLLTYGQA